MDEFKYTFFCNLIHITSGALRYNFNISQVLSFGKNHPSSTNWIGPAGIDPAGNAASFAIADIIIFVCTKLGTFTSGEAGYMMSHLVYHGQSDGYTPYYGEWCILAQINVYSSCSYP